MAGQIAQVRADLQAAQAAAEEAARAVEAARAEDREAKQIREQAVKGKQTAEGHKNAAESQLDELTSQQPEDADTTNTALQDALKAIFDKDAEIRLLQQKVFASGLCRCCSILSAAAISIWGVCMCAGCCEGYCLVFAGAGCSSHVCDTSMILHAIQITCTVALASD